MKANQINPFLHTVKRGGWYAHVFFHGPHNVICVRLDPPTRRGPCPSVWVRETADGTLRYYDAPYGSSGVVQEVSVAQHGQRAAKAALRWLEENYHRIIAERETTA